MIILSFLLCSYLYLIEQFLLKGHTSAWCKEHCDPHKVKELQKVNTVVCEQVFLYLFNI